MKNVFGALVGGLLFAALASGAAAANAVEADNDGYGAADAGSLGIEAVGEAANNIDCLIDAGSLGLADPIAVCRDVG